MAALNSVATAALLRSSWLPGGSNSHRRRFGAAAGCPRAPGRRGAPVSPRELKQQASYRTKCTLYPLLANCKVVHVLNLRRRRMPAASRRVDVRAERVLLADLKAEAQVLIRWLKRPPRHADCDHIHDRLHQQQQDGSQRFQLWGRWQRFQIRKTEQWALAGVSWATNLAEHVGDNDNSLHVASEQHVVRKR